MRSKAPMSHAGPCGRVVPRWSVAGQGALVALSRAGLVWPSARVSVCPPLFPNCAQLRVGVLDVAGGRETAVRPALEVRAGRRERGRARNAAVEALSGRLVGGQDRAAECGGGGHLLIRGLALDVHAAASVRRDVVGDRRVLERQLTLVVLDAAAVALGVGRGVAQRGVGVNRAVHDREARGVVLDAAAVIRRLVARDRGARDRHLAVLAGMDAAAVAVEQSHQEVRGPVPLMVLSTTVRAVSVLAPSM